MKTKNLIIVILSAHSVAYLALCFYVVARTGSTDGLADIGNTTLLWVVATALAVAAGLRRK